MRAIESYNNICVSLDMAQEHLERFTEQRNYYLRLMDSRAPKDIKAQQYSDMPKGSNNSQSLPEILRIIDELESHIVIQQNQIEFYESAKRSTEEHMNELTGLEAEVYKMHVLEGMTLKEVSDRLGYTYQWIRDISRKLNKPTFNQQTP